MTDGNSLLERYKNGRYPASFTDEDKKKAEMVLEQRRRKKEEEEKNKKTLCNGNETVLCQMILLNLHFI